MKKQRCVECGGLYVQYGSQNRCRQCGGKMVDDTDMRLIAACHAMQGILSNPNVKMYTGNIVEDSVKAADELLAELNK